jgi:ABC-2 type transport system permease protein
MSPDAVGPATAQSSATGTGKLSSFAGASALVRLIVRRDRLALPIWIVMPALLAVGIASTFVNLYPTAQARQAFAAQVASSPAETALLGAVYAPTLGGLVAWRWIIPGVVVLGLANLFTVIRHTRTDEEAGRRELLGSTVTGRHADLAAALIVTLVADVVAGLLVAGGLTGSGLPAAGSLALGLGVAAAGWTIAAVAAVAAQLTESAGAAKGIAGAAFGLLYLLRAIGAAGTSSGLGWLSWLSPLGWAGEIRAFAGERWWILALFAGAATLLVAVAGALATRRDIGAGLLPSRLGPATASPGLRSPLALAWRLQRGMLLGWTAMFAVYGILFGFVATVVADQLLANPAMMEFFARLGGGAQPSDVVFTLFFAAFGPVSAIYAIQAALRLRAEEVGLRAEQVLATSARRLEWAASHLLVVALGSAVVLATLGLTAGLTYGLSSSGSAASSGAGAGYELPQVLAAAMVYLPALWVLIGLTAALFGLLPRLVSVSWMVLAGCLLLELGRELQLVSQAVLDLSPFTHVPRLLVGQGSATPLIGLAAAALVLTAAGLVGFRRRDVGRV